MIHVNLASTAGITLATSGKYCTDHVTVVPVLQEKVVAPSENIQIIAPDSEKAGLSRVTVQKIPEPYVNTETNAVAVNARKWTVTVAESFAGTQRKVVLTDPWLAAHYNDERLVISVTVKETAVTVSGQRYFGYLIQSNKLLVDSFAASVSKAHGGCIQNSGSKGTMDCIPISKPLSGDGVFQANYDYYLLSVTSNGELKFCGNEIHYYQPGDYSIIAWLL